MSNLGNIRVRALPLIRCLILGLGRNALALAGRSDPASRVSTFFTSYVLSDSTLPDNSSALTDDIMSAPSTASAHMPGLVTELGDSHLDLDVNLDRDFDIAKLASKPY